MTPEIIHDTLFGALTWNAGYREWQAAIPIHAAETVAVTISTGDGHRDPSDFLPEARQQWLTVLGAFPTVRDAAIAFCVRRYGSIDPGHPLTHDEIADHLSLEGVTLQAGFSNEAVVVVHYGDGDLFGGHSVDVELNPRGGVEDIVLNG